MPPQSLLALASATPRHRHCTSTSALSPRLLSNPYIPLQTRQLDALQSYLTFVQKFNEGLYGSDLAAAGAQTSTRSISRTGNRSGWCCYSTRCRGTECLNGKDSFSQTQLEKPMRSRRCSSCIAEKFELIDDEEHLPHREPLRVVLLLHPLQGPGGSHGEGVVQSDVAREALKKSAMLGMHHRQVRAHRPLRAIVRCRRLDGEGPADYNRSTPGASRFGSARRTPLCRCR